MNTPSEGIEFTLEELQALQRAGDIVYPLKVCFLYGSDEAFHALCSVVTFGKDLASPSKRIKRDARIDLYNRLLRSQQPDLKNYTGVNLSYYEFAGAVQNFSDRWSSQYPFDELLSLAFIVDGEEAGQVSCNGFKTFIEEVEHAGRTNPSFPKEALNAYYDVRREKLYKHAMTAFDSVELRDKLAYLAVLACQFQMQPLHSLFELLEIQSENQAEDVVGFIVQLCTAVNERIQEAAAAASLAVQQEEGAQVAEEMAQERSPNEGSSSGHMDGQPASSVKDASIGEDSIFTAAVKYINHAENQEAQTPLAISDSADSAVKVPLLLSLYSFQNKAQHLTMQLSQVESPNAARDISAMSMSVSRDDILSQLQEMEMEIQRAKEVVGKTTAHSTAAPSATKQGSSGVGKSLPKAQRAPLKSFARPDQGLVTPRGRGSSAMNTSLDASVATAGTGGRRPSMLSASCPTSPIAQKRTNLRIFRSPQNHQIHRNRNKFNETSMTWAPTGVSGGRNERFQTTVDLMIAKKINPVFYNS
ncbi:hypothetical protein B484DRAFT_442166 [Ochromonadaceae sp. CCMP2298]|nr:hypothetical protein B484DRAFT_442166 [Ochromonadaceae sp. CCMP2298]|mmetsp:Transcript_6407/g.14165  ORF Transcript_6407/g.14165 Transcript_6407/m.14165 type:complete len:530 (-) Transcript_6407:47-1636(-)